MKHLNHPGNPPPGIAKAACKGGVTGPATAPHPPPMQVRLNSKHSNVASPRASFSLHYVYYPPPAHEPSFSFEGRGAWLECHMMGAVQKLGASQGALSAEMQ
jgi:hypothetical protein